jgi:hypothetical protein
MQRDLTAGCNPPRSHTRPSPKREDHPFSVPLSRGTAEEQSDDAGGSVGLEVCVRPPKGGLVRPVPLSLRRTPPPLYA